MSWSGSLPLKEETPDLKSRAERMLFVYDRFLQARESCTIAQLSAIAISADLENVRLAWLCDGPQTSLRSTKRSLFGDYSPIRGSCGSRNRLSTGSDFGR